MSIRVIDSRTGRFVSLSVLIAAALLAGCDKKGAKAEGESGKADSTASVRVVVVPAKAMAFEDWGNYSADLRGSDDATLAAPMQGGRVANVTEVGTAVKAGQGLCDIESQ